VLLTLTFLFLVLIILVVIVVEKIFFDIIVSLTLRTLVA
jgi:hypothetical protein